MTLRVKAGVLIRRSGRLVSGKQPVSYLATLSMQSLKLRQSKETFHLSYRTLSPTYANRYLSSAQRLCEAGVAKRPRRAPKDLLLPPADTTSDHRELGTRLSLFTGHPSSPGSPFFHPDGAHIFQKLQSFLRAQYPTFGLREVITPNLYKESLWERSGHWQNYRDAMFSVVGRSAHGAGEDPNYSLKPMNCPGHCLLYKSQKHNFRELPVRYADFSPLHRDEVSGALSGLTRVRRFHQDDGHIFCKPDQVGEEIKLTLKFLDMAYRALNIENFKLVLSTRPEAKYVGTPEQWDRAEEQLRQALNDRGRKWERNLGDGAFYGPKIDIILQDADGKEHQTATIQLDFQLPQRFELEYDMPKQQKGTPVLIHRAIFGSIERFMALMIEKYRGHWPFWISPRQMSILTVTGDEEVVRYAKETARQLTGADGEIDISKPNSLQGARFTVDLDLRDETLAKKIVDAKAKKYNLLCYIGKRNVREHNLDIDITGQPFQDKAVGVFNEIKPGTLSPVQKVLAKKIYRGIQGIKVNQSQLKRALNKMCDSFL